MDKGLAYELGGCIHATKFKGYGKLSHQTIEDLEMGARIEVNEKKASDGFCAVAKSPGNRLGQPWGRADRDGILSVRPWP